MKFLKVHSKRKKSLKLSGFILLLLIFSYPDFQLQAQSRKYFKNWPSGTQPEVIGKILTDHFIHLPHTNFGGKGLPGSITYPEACAWYGAIVFSAKIGDSSALSKLNQRYHYLTQHEKKLLPKPDFVDNNVFGIVPLALYNVTGQPDYLNTGKMYADKEWELPIKANQQQQRMFDHGYSWLSRLWIDDMYMITAIQTMAYRSTKDAAYINRAAKEVRYYLQQLQKQNGLFYHAPNAPFYWGRGNGWVAAGMTELLKSLPKDNADRQAILTAFRKMMRSLKKYQTSNGMWRQLIDGRDSWEEGSATAMFTYAMITGVKEGWLKAKTFGPVARKGWLALVHHLNDKGELKDISEGTNKNASRQFYLDRKRRTGDLHGQAPMLWCAAALLEQP